MTMGDPASAVPARPGFYWAKWCIAADGTEDDGEGCMGAAAVWEVVEVWENALYYDDPSPFLVHVPGVAKGQPIENFYWGPTTPAALEPPR